MKQTYSILRSGAEDNTQLKVVASDFKTRGAALRQAKKWRNQQVEAHGSWADNFYAALLEEV